MAPNRDQPRWPNAGHSRQVRVRPHDWHVQEMGQGPLLILLHGAGASTHSWRDVLPLLARDWRVVAIDLPGHGLSRLGSRHRSSLDCMAADLSALCAHLEWQPAALVGHSAGGAIALRLSQRLEGTPPVIGINPALQPFKGLAGVMFPVVARMIAMTPFMVSVVVRNMADPSRVVALLSRTGSRIDPAGMNLYARLFRDRAHVDGTLLMMAQWKLDGLLADLPRLETRCLFLTGSRDRTVPPVVAVEAAARMKHAQVETLDGYGHLVHEEAPEAVCAAIGDWLGRLN